MTFNSQLSDDTKTYLESKRIPQLLEHLMHELAVATPTDPLAFLVDTLGKAPKPRVMLLGRPCSGKTEVANALAAKYEVPVINFNDLVRSSEGALKKLSDAHGASGGSNASKAAAVAAQLVAAECLKAAKASGGWILEGFPRTLSEAIGLQAHGALPAVVCVLECDAETAAQRVSDSVDTALLSNEERMFEQNSMEVVGCYPLGALRFNIDATVGVEEVVAQVVPKVEATLS